MKGLVDHYIVSQRKVEKQIRKEKRKILKQELEDIENMSFEEAVKYLEFSATFKTILEVK